MTDFDAANHGSLILLMPRTDAARFWIGTHIPGDASRWRGGVAVELRYAGAVIDGIERDGLTIG